eukprot:scaffold29824_cov130-Isochrysis_galbana.AAC.2
MAALLRRARRTGSSCSCASHRRPLAPHLHARRLSALPSRPPPLCITLCVYYAASSQPHASDVPSAQACVLSQHASSLHLFRTICSRRERTCARDVARLVGGRAQLRGEAQGTPNGVHFEASDVLGLLVPHY